MPRDVPVAAGAASRADATLPSCESTLANEPIAATEWQCREAESPHEMDWKVLSPSFTRRHFHKYVPSRQIISVSVSGPSRPDTHPQAPERRAWVAHTQSHRHTQIRSTENSQS